ncbi:astacin [Teladorsagia circumcincta]|uniref:Astacin n=1 Tax=Teladorsagia circumcincta TaxID=45464 RepID=A0A2G9UJB9_TELCI|nr:astacin [Teladorsagia circumcincta]
MGDNKVLGINIPAEDLLLVYKEHGCWAEVGRQVGLQLISLGEGCNTLERRDQFVAKTTLTNKNYDLPYDYGSLMHYRNSE